MSDIRNNNEQDKSTSDSLGLDNENILARHKTGGETPVGQRPRQTVGGARPSSAAPVRRVPSVTDKQATRQMPRQQMPRSQSGSARVGSQAGSAPRQQPRPVGGTVRSAEQPAARSRQPVNRSLNNPAAGAPDSVGRAVVPTGKKEVSPTEVKKSAPVPAYAARRAVAPQNPPSHGSDSSGAQNAADVKTAEDKKSSSTKVGADMMVSIVKSIIYMVLVLVVSVFISIFVIRVGNDVFAFVKSDEQIDLRIPDNATTAEIADILYDNGIIKYPSVFKLYASLKHEKGDYLGGDYTVSPSLSYDKLRAKFKKQIETGTCWITIPEGYTTDEIIDLMVENGIGERETYIDVINNYEFDYWFIKELSENGVSEDRAYRLDGYLFPDSYQFYKASSEVTVINRLLARFNEVFVEDYKTRADELGYSVDQILTIASMVEKEAGRAADFMNVSSVFHNRLNDKYNYAKLQSDATTVYAIQVATGQRPKDITPEDNNYDSPYNTYLYEGLPPGPITNPSASAIRYALYPANTNYKYFVSAKNGTTLFAITKGEHEANIEAVRQMNAD